MVSDKTGLVSEGGPSSNSSRELTPFGQGGGSVFLEFFAAVEMAFEIELIVDGRLDGGELLKALHRPEPVPPKPNCLVSDVYAPFVEQILDVPERKWKPDTHHHRKTDDPWRGFEISERITHQRTLRNHARALKQSLI
jgi:hypothetical protein